MVRIVRIGQLRPDKRGYDYHMCRVYVEEKPEMLKRGRSDVDQTGRLR